MLANISFNGNETLNQLTDLNELVNQYNNKFDHGSSLIDDDFKDKSIVYLEGKRKLVLVYCFLCIQAFL